MGIRSYPIFGPFPDFGDTYTVESAYRKFEKYGYSHQDMTNFVIEQLRRFKPQVAVGHDLNGEYGHTQHKVYARMVTEAVTQSQDPLIHPESAELYGTWDVPKTYIHLYQENPIVMNWDIPMEKFGGMTPYQVTKELGFPVHSSQQKGWGYYFRGYDTCAEILHYSPCEYGLYRSTVAPDENKDDMFENLISYAEQDRIVEEEARRQAEEEARRKAEEEARKASEEAARQASEEAALQAQTTAPQTSMTGPVQEAPPLWLLITAIVLIILILRRRPKKRA